jgi:hypothetical protein
VTQPDDGPGTASAPPRRTERDVLQGLTAAQQQLLKRVLEIELSRLHVKDADLSDDLLNAVKGILP